MVARRSAALKIVSSVVTLAVIALASGGCDPSPEEMAAAVSEACTQLAGPATAKAMEQIKECLAGMDKTERSQACLTDSGAAQVCTSCERVVLNPCTFNNTVAIKTSISVAGYSAEATFNVKVSAKATQEKARTSPSSYSGPPVTETVTYLARYSDVETSFSTGVLANVSSGSLPISAGYSFECTVDAATKAFGKKATETASCGAAAQVPDRDTTTGEGGDAKDQNTEG